MKPLRQDAKMQQHNRNRSRFSRAFKQLSHSKVSVIWILISLIGLSIAGIWVISSLNLTFSQRAMSDLRKVQLQEAFYANFDRINSQHQLLNRYTEDLAVIGAFFWELKKKEALHLEKELGRALLSKLGNFPEAFGVGIWFISGKEESDENSLSAFAYRDNDNPSSLTLLTDDELRGYRRQSWFFELMPEEMTLEQGARTHWTSAYYNPLSEAAVLTLVKPMYDRKEQLIGIVSADWHADKIIDLVSQVEVTPNTLAYLIDRNNRKLSGLSELDDPEEAEEVIEEILRERLIDTLKTAKKPVLSTLQQQRKKILNRHLTVNGREYALSYAATDADMLFGIGVPRDEIDAVLQPMRTGNYRILLLTGSVMLLLSGLILFRVVGLMRRLQASYTDELTQLPNRARLLRHLAKGEAGSLILINIDDFKEVNGLFGHNCGDYVLKNMADKLAACVRSHQWNESVRRDLRLYRLPADEFVILGPAVTREEMDTLLDEIQKAVHGHRLAWQGQEIDIRVTQGAARKKDHKGKDDKGNLMTRAEFALHQARQQKIGFLIYDVEQGIEKAYEYNLLWAGRVKDALRENRILAYFQPIYDNNADTISKYECLVRMRLESGEIANPGQFLDIARKVRLDRQITQAMVDISFAMFADQPYEFSINLSYADLTNEWLTRYILNTIDNSDIGSRVIFEILESDGIDDYMDVCHFIDEAKARGCRIAIDDFGTGYSNFEHLLRLNVDIIKIDGSLIRHLDTDPTAFDVTRGIVKFAHSLKMVTVAEFVHSEKVLEKVRQLNIDYSQGAVISMPQPELMSETDKSTSVDLP